MNEIERQKVEKKNGLNYVFFLIYGPLALIFATAAYFSSRPAAAVSGGVKATPMPIFALSESSISLAGYRLGDALNLDECPIEKNNYGVNSYSANILINCYRHLSPTRVGRPVIDAESIEIDRLDLARIYPIANWAAPICIAMIRGHVEAVELALEPYGVAGKTAAQVLTDAAMPLRSPTAHRSYTPDPVGLPNFQVNEWTRTENTAQIASYTFAGSGRGGGTVTVFHAIIFSEKAKAVAGSTWRTSRTFCGANFHSIVPNR